MLFLRELKKTVFSISYILFVVIVVFSLFSQGVLDFSDSKIGEPEIGGNYGTKNEEVPEIIMPAALQALYDEFLSNNYRTYPIGFIKNVKLNDNEQMKIAEIIADLTGMDADEIYKKQENSNYDRGDISFEISENLSIQSGDNGSFTVAEDGNAAQEESRDLIVREDISYSEFKERMQEADDILGGGSEYAKESLIGFGMVPVTYEEAKEAYELVKKHDKMTGGYARLFSDYAVTIAFSVLPVFSAVIMSMRDKRAKMSELIYTRRVLSVKIVFIRYLAVITAVMLPAVILSYVSNASVWSMYQGMELDYFAPLKYDIGWILPSAMISTAAGMCLTELTGTPIAVAVQGLWWFVDINTGIRSVASSYSLFRLAPRHNAGENSYFRTQDYIGNFGNLLANRLLFAGLAILLVCVTVIIFEAKRRGKLNGNVKIKEAFANIKNRQN